jgi:hypothetical protein
MPSHKQDLRGVRRNQRQSEIWDPQPIPNAIYLLNTSKNFTICQMNIDETPRTVSR